MGPQLTLPLLLLLMASSRLGDAPNNRSARGCSENMVTAMLPL